MDTTFESEKDKINNQVEYNRGLLIGAFFFSNYLKTLNKCKSYIVDMLKTDFSLDLEVAKMVYHDQDIDSIALYIRDKALIILKENERLEKERQKAIENEFYTSSDEAKEVEKELHNYCKELGLSEISLNSAKELFESYYEENYADTCNGFHKLMRKRSYVMNYLKESRQMKDDALKLV